MDSNVLDDGSATPTVLVMAKIGAMMGLGCGSMMLGMLPLIVGRCRRRRDARHAKRPRGRSSNSSASTVATSASSEIETETETETVAVPADAGAGAGAGAPTLTTDSQGLPTSLLLCFGGGVLLFTTFLHLAPEVRASVERHQSNGQLPALGTLSLAELLFCTGFFLVYLVEEAVHAALTGKPESSETLLYRTVSVRRCNNNQTQQSTSTSHAGSTSTVSTSTRSTWKDERVKDEEEGRSELGELQEEIVLPGIFVLSGRGANGIAVELGPTSVPSARHQHEKHGPRDKSSQMKKKSSIQGLLTVLALSFHAIFEGLAVGLEPAIGSVVYLAAAIATHKLVISFCVGMELYVAGASSRTTLGYLSVFSMVTPIGIAVGLALGHFKNDSENLGATPTILQGMAAGTLLYVVFFEVLARERANEKSGLLQLAAILLGFMLMLSLQIFTAHSHSHSHSHSHEADGGADESSHGHGHGHSLSLMHSQGQSAETIDRVTETVTETVAELVTAILTSNDSGVVAAATAQGR